MSELREHAPSDELTCRRTWSMGNVKTLDRPSYGVQPLSALARGRNGDQPGSLKMPDRSGSGVKFNSNVAPAYIRRLPRGWNLHGYPIALRLAANAKQH